MIFRLSYCFIIFFDEISNINPTLIYLDFVNIVVYFELNFGLFRVDFLGNPDKVRYVLQFNPDLTMLKSGFHIFFRPIAQEWVLYKRPFLGTLKNFLEYFTKIVKSQNSGWPFFAKIHKNETQINSTIFETKVFQMCSQDYFYNRKKGNSEKKIIKLK